MLGHLVQAHDDETYAMPRGSLLRWLKGFVGAIRRLAH